MNISRKLWVGVSAMALTFSTAACTHQDRAPPLIDTRPLIDKRATVSAATFLDNRDQNWYLANIPFIDTPDPVIDDTFYYRFDMMTKHFVYGSPADGYAVTEFIDKPEWSGAYGAIGCPLGLQFSDLRWLRDQRVARDYARYWLHVPGAQPRRYTNWFAASMWGLYEAWGDKAFILSMLPDMKAQYAAWVEERWNPKYMMFVWDGMQDGMETNINSRQIEEIYYGDNAVRPTFNSYMYADAKAIAAASRLAGDDMTAALYDKRAADLKKGVQDLLWDPERQFFFPMAAEDHKLAEGKPGKIAAGSLTYRSGPFAGSPYGRELLGLVPWQFNLPDQGYEVAWQGIKDPAVFQAPFGPTTTERHDPMFMKTDYCCTWSGNSWPFATSQTLEAMANLLNNYDQSVVSKADYYTLLRTYSLTQRKDGVPFVAEAANPDTGQWQITPDHSEHYFHSSYVDLVITGLAGLRPDAGDKIVVNPMIPADWDWFVLEDVPYHGRLVTILWDRNGKHFGRRSGLSLIVDGELRAWSPTIGRLEVPLSRRDSPPVDRSANYAVSTAESSSPRLIASSSSKDAPVAAANDGLRWYSKAPANRWTSAANGGKQSWLELDFGRLRLIDRLRLFVIDDGEGERVRAPAKFLVESWDADRGWVKAPLHRPIRQLRGHQANEIAFAKSFATEKLRLTLVHRPGSEVGLSEIEAWGPPPATH